MLPKRHLLRFERALVTLLVLAAPQFALASITATYDWAPQGVATPWASVTATYYTAAELGGSNNRFDYSVTNLTTDSIIRLFRVLNPDNLAHDMVGPAGWAERTGTQSFIWETSDPASDIAPGATLGGFQLFTTGIRDVLTSPPFDYNAKGWAEFSRNGLRVDVFGDIAAPRVVPLPGALFLFMPAVAGIAAAMRRR